jgi:hypothetical protein
MKFPFSALTQQSYPGLVYTCSVSIRLVSESRGNKFLIRTRALINPASPFWVNLFLANATWGKKMTLRIHVKKSSKIINTQLLYDK